MNPLKSFNFSNVYKKICGENTPGTLVDKIKPFIEKNAKQAIEEWKIAKEKMKDIPGTNYNLGLLHLKNGNLDDAILRFKMVIFLTPERSEAYYSLAKCLVIIGDNDAAQQNLEKALSLKGEFPEAKYIMDKIKSPDSLDEIPTNIVAEHVEWSADFSPEENEAGLEKDRVLTAIALANILDKNPNLAVLDLGCGEGARGLLLKTKEVANKIVGVDLSSAAIKKAKAANLLNEVVYSVAHESEVSSYLSANQDKYDLILAGDIFSYRGKLDSVFINIARSLVPGGMFAIIINKDVDEKSGYKLDVAKDKFIHSVEYFEETLKKSGFTIVDKKEKQIAGDNFDIIIAKSSSNTI